MTTQLTVLDLKTENRYWKKGFASVVGIDEVGRGCLAGIVVAAAVIFPAGHVPIEGINDSKKLSAKKREMLDILIRQQAVSIGIGEVDAQTIDAIGIVGATKLAMKQACKNFQAEVILVDGASTLGLKSICDRVEAVIKGDSKIYSIAAASIVAKVYRDKWITTLSAKYPGYNWQDNKGYGTKRHRQAIKKFGLTPYHRKSFIFGQ